MIVRLPPQHWLHTRRTGVTVVILLATLTTGASGLILHAGTSGLQSDRMATNPYRPVEAGSPPQPEQPTPGAAAASTAPAPLDAAEQTPAAAQNSDNPDSSLPRAQTAPGAPPAAAGPRTQNSDGGRVPASEPNPPRTDPTFGAATNEEPAHTFSQPPASTAPAPTASDKEPIGPNMRDVPRGNNEYELVTPRPTSAPAPPASSPSQGGGEACETHMVTMNCH